MLFVVPAFVIEPVFVTVSVWPLMRAPLVTEPPEVLVNAEPSYVLEASAAFTVIALLLTVNLPFAFVTV